MPCPYSLPSTDTVCSLGQGGERKAWGGWGGEGGIEGEKYLQFGFIILPGFVKRLFEVLKKQKICLEHLKNFVFIVKTSSYINSNRRYSFLLKLFRQQLEKILGLHLVQKCFPVHIKTGIYKEILQKLHSRVNFEVVLSTTYRTVVDASVRNKNKIHPHG